MAAHMRSVLCLLSRGHGGFVSRSCRTVTVTPSRFVRGLRRKPVNVLFPDEELDTKKNKKPPPPPSSSSSSSGGGHQFKVHSEHVSVKDMTDKPAHVSVSQDPLDGLHFETSSPGDKRLARLASVARSRTFREQQNKILLEGRRLICDALDAGANPQMFFFSSVDRLRELPVDKLRRATLVKVKFEDIKIWSDLVTPQGVIAIFSRPDPSRLKFVNTGHSVPLTLICDNVRDPGNLGTMLRCAAAAGCHSVLLSKGCVDAWEPKVLRAAMGAHFRLPIYTSLDWTNIEDHLPKPVSVHVADSSSVPDAHRQTHEPQDHVSHKPKAGDHGWVSTRRSLRDVSYEEHDSDSDSDSEDEGLSLPRLDTRLYHETWAQRATALVIGGETHGLSVESVQLAEQTGGHRLFIPVVPGVDSLNSAMAASVLLFEGRKQLLKLRQTSGREWKSKAEAKSR
uniref:rRNA methyltransferase 3A, mitochondrial n=1 Tax=Solea senegalensis TaxID=28829 RepID=UPI001CD8E546|nr:rRNA methyltransferase 3A, mitochondrial [Solea senegalensis]